METIKSIRFIQLQRQFVVLMILSFVSLSTFSDSARYTITEWSPYWIIESGKVSGILNDIMLQLDKHTDITLEAGKPVPVKRAKRQFKAGEAQIECCINKAWRPSPEQREVSLWTDTVLSVEEVLIFPHKGVFEFNTLEDLEGKLIATIRGYGYVGSEYFRRSDSNDNISQITKVGLGRGDAGIIDRIELAHILKNSAALNERNIKIEEGPIINRSELKMRVHISRPELIQSINVAIAKMKQEGTITRIINSYIK